MAQFIAVPTQRIEADSLLAMLEEYASRDGTDYGEREISLRRKVRELQLQLDRGELLLVYEVDAGQWDLLPPGEAQQLLNSQ